MLADELREGHFGTGAGLGDQPVSRISGQINHIPMTCHGSRTHRSRGDQSRPGSSSYWVNALPFTNDEDTMPTTTHRWRAFALLAVANFMTIIDLTIVNVAMPTIGRKLGFDADNLSWIVTAYGITFGGLLLLAGRAADLLGRRRVFMTGLAVFTAASLACGLATDDTFLILVRAIQGMGAATVLPAGLAIVMNMFPEGA
jgi:hypothetical protein